jgi:hypothetical protein
MINSFLRLSTATLWLLFSLYLPAAFAAVEKTGLEGLEWRLIGPWRGEHVAMPDL